MTNTNKSTEVVQHDETLMKVLCEPYTTSNDSEYEASIKFSLIVGDNVECYDMPVSDIRKFFKSEYTYPVSNVAHF